MVFPNSVEGEVKCGLEFPFCRNVLNGNAKQRTEIEPLTLINESISSKLALIGLLSILERWKITNDV